MPDYTKLDDDELLTLGSAYRRGELVKPDAVARLEAIEAELLRRHP
jgi:hypothetical protein